VHTVGPDAYEKKLQRPAVEKSLRQTPLIAGFHNYYCIDHANDYKRGQVHLTLTMYLPQDFRTGQALNIYDPY